MKNKIVIYTIIFTIILIRAQINGKIVERFIKISEEGHLVELEILKTQRR